MKTIKTKTSTLNSLALDWAVATLQGFTVKHNPMGFSSGPQSGFWIWEDKGVLPSRQLRKGREVSNHS